MTVRVGKNEVNNATSPIDQLEAISKNEICKKYRGVSDDSDNGSWPKKGLETIILMCGRPIVGRFVIIQADEDTMRFAEIAVYRNIANSGKYSIVLRISNQNYW